MFILFPIGRKTTLYKFPWFTLGLIVFNILIFFATWPQERRFLKDRVSHEQIKELGGQLVEILVDSSSEIPDPIKSSLKKEKESKDFPTSLVDEIFQSVNDGTIMISPKSKYPWEMMYPRYTAFKKSLAFAGSIPHSAFFKYGFSSKSALFPNILTYQFLHAGILHILFNMFFLWLVGCNVEERWGPMIFMALYLLGGVTAALVQAGFYPQSFLYLWSGLQEP